MIQLSAIFSDGMILQRECENQIWGQTAPDSCLSLNLRQTTGGAQEGSDNYFSADIRADLQGYFSFTLPPLGPGGPWEITIVSEGERKVITDVLFGDVFLLGGQSNMELPFSFPSLSDRYARLLEETKLDQIRQFEVPKEYEFCEERRGLHTGRWVRACGEELLTFSAVGFFAARALCERHGVPVGLYQTAVGGTPVKAWCAPETIETLGLDVEDLVQCRDQRYVEQTLKEEAQRDKSWRTEAFRAFGQTDEKQTDGTWGDRKRSFVIPRLFTGTSLEGVTGGIRFRRRFSLDSRQTGEARLYFGAMIDADEIWINGVKIGETDHRYPPRIYSVPDGVLRQGENDIEVRLLVFGQLGGFMPGKRYELCLAGGETLSLEGEWECEVVKELPGLPEMTFFQYKAAGLYRGMLCPLRGIRMRGVFFYQGESNTWRAETYRKEFCAMVSDWHSLFGQEKLPFLFVQLAGYSDGQEQTDGTDWARLREAQRMCGQEEGMAMVQAYDLGEFNDLHPSEKEQVGLRLAEAAEVLVYGNGTYSCGPRMSRCLRSSGGVSVEWSEGPLKVYPPRRGSASSEISGELDRNGTPAVRGFEYRGADGGWHPAEAVLEDSCSVRVEVPVRERVFGLRYAWNDCPDGCTLYAETGLPAVPFCEDELHNCDIVNGFH